MAPAPCGDTATPETIGDAGADIEPGCVPPAPSGSGSPDDPVSSDGGTPETTVPPASDGGGSSGSSGSSSGGAGTTVPMSDDPTSGRGLERPTSPPVEPSIPRPAD